MVTLTPTESLPCPAHISWGPELMFHDPFKLCIIMRSVSHMKGNGIMDNKELCYMLDLDPDTVEYVNITRKDEKYVFNIVIMI